MNISPDEAEEALKLVQKTAQRTRNSIAKGGTYIFLIITGLVWMVGYIGTQFFSARVSVAVWLVSASLGSLASFVMGRRLAPRVHGPAAGQVARRAIFFWGCLALFCLAVIAVVHPADGKQTTAIIVLFIMIGQLSMGFLLSFSSTWWTLPISGLALVGYFFFSNWFYLWMGLLVGGAMVALGLYIRRRW